jgi:hypothetical protein
MEEVALLLAAFDTLIEDTNYKGGDNAPAEALIQKLLEAAVHDDT